MQLCACLRAVKRGASNAKMLAYNLEPPYVLRVTLHGWVLKQNKKNAGKMKKKMKQNRGYRMSDTKLEARNTSNMVCRYVMEVVHGEAWLVRA